MATKAEYREISSDELAAKLLELPRRPLLAGEQGIRLSLAGAQRQACSQDQWRSLLSAAKWLAEQLHHQAAEFAV